MADDTSQKIPLTAFGWSLGSFFAISYLLCIAFGLVWPDLGMHKTLAILPGFEWLTWRGVLLGLVWTQIFAWYTALVFGWLFNYFAAARV